MYTSIFMCIYSVHMPMCVCVYKEIYYMGWDHVTLEAL
jgi:hypothetical protein